ncbi:MAG: ABC transporter ATP-binding protein [Dehalococcoidales bacterium]|nr:ABC transporter ATP-binding protein [Dehalococcoidales bacterium]
MAANAKTSEWAIEVQGLTKSFGSYQALRGVDLKIKSGESVVIFGPNGAGKTTLIKILSSVMNPSSGKVLVNGLSLKDNAEEARRHIGVVTHQTYLYGNLTAYENLDFYSRMYDVPSRKERIEELVDMVGMTYRLHERVDTFSRGMQQRISIARCLLHKPSIILLDEPETGLDTQATAMLWDIMRQEKRTIILTIHSLERGLELCERLLILVKGKIAYEGMSQALGLAGLQQAYQQCTTVGV